MTVEEQKKAVANHAAQFVKNGMVLGLGTGSTAYYLIQKVGEMVAMGMEVHAVATSSKTEYLAQKNNIPLISADKAVNIHLTIDGVDEIDQNFCAVKGGGGALMREKIVVEWSDEVIWIMDERKLVHKIGAFPLAVEVLPFGCQHILKTAEDLGFSPELRKKGNTVFYTDNGNFIIDLHNYYTKGKKNVLKLRNVPGVLEIGIFDHICSSIVIGTKEGVKTIINRNVERNGILREY